MNSVTPRGSLRRLEPMSRHTSWRVGGPADRYFEPQDREDLISFVSGLESQEPLMWIGLGSNLLVRDGGLRGTVVCLHGSLDGLERDQDGSVRADAGVHCARLAKFCVSQGLAGSAFMVGIPGTVGGALAMNAGAHGGDTWTFVREVEVLFRDGRTQWLSADAFETGYRKMIPPAGFAGFLAARFVFPADQEGQAAANLKQWLAQRKATQPVGKPSCGSVFRNPPNDHAARLIEVCGLKGHRIGGAVVSELHANFILNEAEASAAEIEALINEVRDTVRERTGVELLAEVRIVGEALTGAVN